MFAFGKLVHVLIDPLNVVLLLVVGGAALRAVGWTRAGGRMLWAAATLTAIVSLTPLSGLLAYRLETRIAASHYDLDALAGVIVLGGATGHGELAREHGTYQINDAAERLATIVALRRQRADLPVLVSGGSGRLFPSDVREAEITRMFLADMGVDPESVAFETRSRNTYENGVYSAEMLADRPGRYLLVTSAMHMPRALGVFRQAGVDVIPHPVDHRIAAPELSLFAVQPLERFSDLDAALREIVGLVSYRLLGRTDALYPDDA